MADPETSAALPDPGEGQSAYRVLARKYRPTRFEDLVGQEALVRTLTNAFDTGRIAQAYMLTGVRGIGKTTTARLIARALNYSKADKPTVDMPEMGDHCAAILESRHVDVIEMDAATHTGVDSVREINDAVRYKPAAARYKVYIIDEVHMLSKAAFNALLKTLEEPPPHVKFIFATTEIHKVPVTVLSRCQRFDLRRLDTVDLMKHLKGVADKEQVAIDEESLRMIARAAEGSVRDGLSLLDQAIAYGDGAVKADEVQSMLGLADRSRVIALFEAVMKGDAAAAIKGLEQQYSHGADPYLVIVELARFVHFVTRLKVVPASPADAAHTEAERTAGRDFAERLGMAALARAWQMLLKGLDEVSQSADPLMAAEMLLIRLCHAANLPNPADVLEKLTAEQATAPGPASSSASPVPAAPVSAVVRPAAEPPAAGPRTTASLARKPADADVDTAPPAAATTFAAFADVVAYVGARRDVKLKGELERYVRPVALAPGRLEIALEADAPGTLAGELSRKLEAWTGQRWMVLVSNKTGDKPLAEQARDARASQFRAAREVPAVRAALELFPGAEIVNVENHEGLAGLADPADPAGDPQE